MIVVLIIVLNWNKGIENIKEIGKGSLNGNMISLYNQHRMTLTEKLRIVYGIDYDKSKYLEEWRGLQ